MPNVFVTIMSVTRQIRGNQPVFTIAYQHSWGGNGFVTYTYENAYYDPELMATRPRMMARLANSSVYPAAAAYDQEVSFTVDPQTSAIIPIGNYSYVFENTMNIYDDTLDTRYMREVLKSEIVQWYASIGQSVALSDVYLSGVEKPNENLLPRSVVLYRGAPVAIRKLPNRQWISASDPSYLKRRGRLLIRETRQLITFRSTDYRSADLKVEFSQNPLLTNLQYRVFFFPSGLTDIGQEDAIGSIALAKFSIYDVATDAMTPIDNVLFCAWSSSDAIGQLLADYNDVQVVVGLYRTGWPSNFSTANVSEAGRVIRATLEFE